MKMLQIINKLFVFVVLIICVSLPVCAQDPLKQIREIYIEDGKMFLEFIGGVPVVNFKTYDEEGKILIELMEADYDDAFVFDLPLKRNILNGLDFLDNVSIGKAKYGEGFQKIGIWLNSNTIKYPDLFQEGHNYLVVSFSDEKKVVIEDDGNKQSDKEEISETGQLLLTVNDLKKEEKKFLEEESQIAALYNEAIENHVAGKLNLAENLYKKVLELKPDFNQVSYNLSRLYMDMGRYEEALEILKELAKHYSDTEAKDEKMFVLVSNAIGVAYFMQDDLKKAFNILKDTKELEPDFYETYYNLGLVYEKKYDIKKAKVNFEKTLELKDDYIPAYYHLGVLSLLDRDKKKAIVNFEKIIEISPESQYGKLSQNELQEIKK
ncbi:MAG: tetratricopeptide repeat protein [Candidatus Melainabacteria bacterium]|nr:tetratricopeptide repeat protein [Candidatus Melainabacteria bacterium]